MNPLQENVTERVVRTHSFEHHIRWDYVLIVLAVLLVTYSFRHSLLSRDGGSGRRDPDPEGEVGPTEW